jgi:rieske iron-sulfur protein
MEPKFSKERRDALKGTCVLAGAAALGMFGGIAKAFAAGGPSDYPQPPGAPKTHDTFVYNDGPNKGKDVKTAEILLDVPPISVQAKDGTSGEVRESEKSSVLLYRVQEDTIPIEWRSDSAHGILAYSAICTKDATLIEPKDWDEANKKYVCSTCKTTYDPINGGEVTAGPGERALPQVPVADHEGLLRISHGIIGWVGLERR